MKTITKRDGRVVDYNEEKVTNAIYKAAQAVGGSDVVKAAELAKKVTELLDKRYPDDCPTVENAQDIIETVLIDAGHAKTAKAYILFRNNRTRVREMNTSLMKVYEDLTFTNSKDCDKKRENANINTDTAMGTMLKYGSEGAKQFNLLYAIDPEASAEHTEGWIHIHDLDFYMLTMTCCQIDIGDLLERGFHTGHGFLRPPQSVQSAAAQTCIAIQSNQNDMHGGQAIYALDFGLAPFVAKSWVTEVCNHIEDVCEEFDDAPEELAKIKQDLKNYLADNELIMNNRGREYTIKLLSEHNISEKVINRILRKVDLAVDKLTYQAMEAVVHNLNTMQSRAGSQVPFSSLNLGTDTSTEGRLITKNLLLNIDAGMGDGETPIFPVTIFKMKAGVNYNKTDPNYDLFRLACKVSAKRLFPNFSNLDVPFNAQYYTGTPESEVSYMGCRTRVIGNVNGPEIVAKRGNLSFTSINLPRLAIEAHGDIDKFYEMLYNKLELVKKQLIDRYRVQCSKQALNFPMLMQQGVWLDSEKLEATDSVANVLKHGTLGIGFIGLAECLTALIGKHHGESEEAQKLGLEIITYMRKYCDDQCEKYSMNFSLLATPAEGLSGRFLRIDRAKYGVIPGVTDKEYYTNSNHVPVNYPITVAQKIDIEAPYHALTNGGHICYVELDGDTTDNVDAFERVIRYMHDAGIGYGAINHPVDRCNSCGYQGVIKTTCPKCGALGNDENIERIRRITGYLVGTLSRFNNAKRAEEHDRIKHGLGVEKL